MELRVELRKGGLEAVAVLGDGPLDPERAAQAALERLRELGVRSVPPIERLRNLLAAVGTQAAFPDGVVLARGEPPQPGVPAQILTFFPIDDTPLDDGADPFERYADNVVYPGDPLLQKTPPSPGIPGRSLLGAAIPARDGSDIPILAGDGVTGPGDDNTYRSTTYGVVLFNRGRLWVADAVAVAEDRMEVRLIVMPDPRAEEAVQLQKLITALEILGVRAGIDREALAEAVRKARAEGRPVSGVVAARGRAPVHGREAGYEIRFDPEKKVGKVLDGGRIDFREAEAVKNVRKGEPLADVIPPVEPVPGFLVDGSQLRPRLERFRGLKPGQNTAPSDDGSQVVAQVDGMIVVKGGKFHVVDEYLVSDDVDYRTGNIRASGNVRVRGGVKPGFEVEAGKDVTISGDVEQARIKAEGEVRVQGGITAESHVSGGRAVKAKYILSSVVESEGDVEVAGSITNARVYARGRVRAVGSQGTIMGGEVNAALGIEARTVGSPSSRTHVAVGVDLRVLREIERIDKERSAVLDEIRVVQSNLGKAFLKDPRAALAAIPPALRKGKVELLQRMKVLYETDKELSARRDELAALQREQQAAQITVLAEIHAGTRLTCATARTTLTETLRRVVLYYDPAENRILWRRL